MSYFKSARRGGRHGGSASAHHSSRQQGSYRGRPKFARAHRGPARQRLNPALFVNKVVLTEEVQVFRPEHAFADFAIDNRLKQAVLSKGFVSPTPIQDRTIPHILKGLDLVGIANTGTGKTAAFLLPLIHKVLMKPAEKIMIIVPTRELALQIDQEFKDFSRGLSLFSVCAVGGLPIGRQIAFLRRGHNFVIGTPGRLKDLIERGVLSPATFRTIVLDEADRMLDMGFIGDMRQVMSLMPADRQTLFFSATLTPEIERLIGEFLKDPVRISVKTGDTSKNVEQDVVKLAAGRSKFDTLQDLLSGPDFRKVLIFGQTKHGVERLSQTLISRGFKAESIHGNKNHNKRQQALKLFKDGHIQILVATDVAARGLDIADVSHVINYELPMTYEDYVHRIGRTGRGNKRGKALTFIE